MVKESSFGDALGGCWRAFPFSVTRGRRAARCRRSHYEQARGSRKHSLMMRPDANVCNGWKPDISARAFKFHSV